MKKKIVSALLTATMVCGMSVVPAVGVAAADGRQFEGGVEAHRGHDGGGRRRGA